MEDSMDAKQVDELERKAVEALLRWLAGMSDITGRCSACGEPVTVDSRFVYKPSVEARAAQALYREVGRRDPYPDRGEGGLGEGQAEALIAVLRQAGFRIVDAN